MIAFACKVAKSCSASELFTGWGGGHLLETRAPPLEHACKSRGMWIAVLPLYQANRFSRGGLELAVV